MNAIQVSLPKAIQLSWQGARENIRPALALWIIGASFLLLYRYNPAVSESLTRVGQFKESTSPWFAIITMGVAGGLLPWLLQKIFLPRDKQQAFQKAALLFLFWAIHGLQVDFLYNLQAKIFGNSADLLIVTKKLIVDQLIWGPFLAIPQILFAYLFIENKLSLKSTKQALIKTPFMIRYLPMLIAGWLVWIPTVMLIYLFPLPLQLPFQNIILCFWSMILLFFTKNS